MNAVKCKLSSDCQGFLLPTKPTCLDSQWKCQKCSKVQKCAKIMEFILKVITIVFYCKVMIIIEMLILILDGSCFGENETS